MARSLEARIVRLEASAGRASDYTNAVQAAWDLEAARARAAAWVRLKIGETLGAVGHPAVESAREFLMGDTPSQAAEDLEILQRWGRQHPHLLNPDEEGYACITQKLEEMVQRMEAQR